MGKVVGIDGRRRRRRRRSRTALVLGGGGFTGAVYEIGALRALDLLTDEPGVRGFDVYVGTSAGAFVAAMCASGVPPEEMMRVLDGERRGPFPDMGLSTVLRPNWGEFARKGVELPFRAAGLLREVAPQLARGAVLDVALGLAGALPSGMYTGAGLERYVREVLDDPSRTDDFRALRRELLLVATDLDTGERVVLGAEGWDDVPISTAVRASTALPMVYAPVEVHGRELVDGGVVSTTNLDLAVEAGAELIVVVNPLVPFVNDRESGRHVSDMGLPQVGFQAFKLMAHQRLHEQARSWEQRYPGVDIVLVEPARDDELMFQTSIMNYAKRVEIARHGFESVTRQLADGYDGFRSVCDRHGIAISDARLRQVAEELAAAPEPTAAWRRMLEHTTGALRGADAS